MHGGLQIPGSKQLQYLVQATIDQVHFFTHALPYLQNSSDAALGIAVAEYSQFVCGKNNSWGESVPSLGVEIVWRSHLLQPSAYLRSCHMLYGRVVDHTPQHASTYPLTDDDHVQTDTTVLSGAWLEGVDLVGAMRQQQHFMEQILEQNQQCSEEYIVAAVERYAEFLASMRSSAVTEPTCLLVDLVWHTHQLFPCQYAADCIAMAGHQVDHQAVGRHSDVSSHS